MGILRVHYRERQRLDAPDLRLEQDYRLGLGGRHQLAHHGWGIVRGLRLVAGEAGKYVLTPGVAIDGYGREIVVATALAVDVAGLPRDQCNYVQLYCCEDAPQACGAPALRIGPRAVLALTPGLARPTPAPAPDRLVTARAAGAGGTAPWPVLVATFGTGCNPDGSLVAYNDTRYCAHQAAMIRAPNGRAAIQLGLSSRVDFYHFVLSTRNAAGSMARRIGIDRHATLHVWGQLAIHASLAMATVDVGRHLQLRLVMPMPGGIGTQARLEVACDARLNNLTATLRASAGGPVLGAASATLARDVANLVFDDGRLGTVRLFDTNKGAPLPFSSGRKRVHDAAGAMQSFLAPLDAGLALKNDGAARPGALLFRPAKTPADDPLVRTLQAIDTTQPGDPVPGTALQIAGGPEDKTDTAGRIAIGAVTAGAFFPVLQMDGRRRITLCRMRDQEDQTTLKVMGTVYLPPIGAKDALLPEMLLLAQMSGLWRAGRIEQSITLTLALPEAPPEGPSLQATVPAYRVSVNPQPGTTYTVRQTMELITSGDGTGDLTFRAIALPLATSTAIGRSDIVALPKLARAAGTVNIILLMLVEVRQHAAVVVSNPLQVPL